MRMNFIIMSVCAFILAFFFFKGLFLVDFLGEMETFALFGMMHIIFGLFAGSFMVIFTKDMNHIFIGSFAILLAWEIYEQLFHNVPATYPLDTVYDLFIGVGFAMLYAYKVNK